MKKKKKNDFSLQTPSCAKLKTWDTVEANGLVYVWYHIDGIGPTWMPVVLKQLDQKSFGSWVYQGRNEFEVRRTVGFDLKLHGFCCWVDPCLHSFHWSKGLHLHNYIVY